MGVTRRGKARASADREEVMLVPQEELKPTEIELVYVSSE